MKWFKSKSRLNVHDLFWERIKRNQFSKERENSKGPEKKKIYRNEKREGVDYVLFVCARQRIKAWCTSTIRSHYRKRSSSPSCTIDIRLLLSFTYLISAWRCYQSTKLGSRVWETDRERERKRNERKLVQSHKLYKHHKMKNSKREKKANRENEINAYARGRLENIHCCHCVWLLLVISRSLVRARLHLSLSSCHFSIARSRIHPIHSTLRLSPHRAAVFVIFRCSNLQQWFNLNT